jgi:hypothetical protein
MTTSNFNVIATPTSVWVRANGKDHTIDSTHPNFARIQKLLEARNFTDILPLMDVRQTVKDWLVKNPRFALVSDRISLDGEPFSDVVTQKVLSMIDAGVAPNPLFNFLLKVRQNPSKTAQSELLLFWLAAGQSLHEDGDIIGYKSVRGNYLDIHSGTVMNTVGKLVEMPRHQVDDNRDKTCSTGYHVAAFNYASTWNGTIDGIKNRLMVIKVNPADIVSIPADHNNEKCRTCKYVVVAECIGGRQLPDKVVLSDADIGVVTQKSASNSSSTTTVSTRLQRRRNRRAELDKTIKTLEDEINTLQIELATCKEWSPTYFSVASEIKMKKNVLVEVKRKRRNT